MKKMLPILVSSIIMLNTAAFATEFNNAKVLDHTNKIVGGTGSVVILPYDGKKRVHTPTTKGSCYAEIGSGFAYVNDYYNMQGNYSWAIYNSTNSEQTYEIDMKVSADGGKFNENLWHIKLDPHETSRNSSVEGLAIQYDKPGTYSMYADLYVRGSDGCEDHDSAYLTVAKMNKK